MPGVASRVREATWHPTQSLETEADGSLRWRATVSGTIEIRLWILHGATTWRSSRRPALRDDVADTHRRALARYG